MKRLLALLAVLVGSFAVNAAEPGKPAIEFRLKSLVDLLPVIEYGGELAGQANNAEQVAAIIKMFAEQGKGLEGIDLKKPFGGYLVATENVIDSPIVIMVPVATEEAFLGLLTDRANLAPKKQDDGTYSIELPNVPFPLYLRFANDYAYFSIRSAAGIAKDQLLTPKAFFATKHDSLFELNVAFDRIPLDLRKTVYGQLEMFMQASINATEPVQKATQTFLADRFTDMVKTLLLDGEKFALTLSADPKTDELALNLSISPKAGTSLAKTFEGWADRPSTAASMATTAKNRAFALAINFGLPSETKAQLRKTIDGTVENALANAKEADKTNAKFILDAVLPTLRLGQIELGVAGIGPDSKGKFTGVFGLRTESGKELDKISRLMSIAVPKAVADIKFDTAKIGEGQLHTLKSAALANPKFAADTLQIYASDPLIAATLATDADGLKKMVTSKPAKTPMLHAAVSVVKVYQATQEVEADKLAKMVDEAFGKPVRDGDDVISLTISGGKEFQFKLAAKGRALSFLRIANQ